MPIKNYRTEVNVDRTANEINKMLADAGAKAVLTEYDDAGAITNISFRINTPHGLISFRMPLHVDGTQKVLIKQNVAPRYRTRQHCTRIALRNLKDWIAATLARNQAGQGELAELFLSYAQNAEGVTVYEGIKNAGFKLLTHGGGKA